MSISTSTHVPQLEEGTSLPLLTGTALVLGVLLALPLTQRITDMIRPASGPVIEPTFITDPIPMPPPKSLIENPDAKPIDKLDVKPVLPTIDQMEVAFGDVDFNGMTTDIYLPGIVEADPIINIGDLSRAPKAISQMAPAYPPSLRQARIEGSVLVEFVVRKDGTTSQVTVLRSDNPLFSESAVRAVRKWIFTPGEKDGKVVNSRASIRIPFQIK